LDDLLSGPLSERFAQSDWDLARIPPALHCFAAYEMTDPNTPKVLRYPIPEITALYATDRALLATHYKEINKVQAGVPLRGWKRRLSATFIAAKKGNEAALNQLKEIHARIIVEKLTK
jgi:hypothetical protein